MVTILLPTYNRLPLLKKCIESCLDQTYKDFEILVIDDGSTDETENWLKEQIDPRIRVYRQENAGLCYALNRGLELARGEYIQILNDDDMLPKESTAALATYLNSNLEQIAVFGAMHFIDIQDKIIRSFRVIFPKKHIGKMGYEWRWSKPMFRKNVLPKVGNFNPEFLRIEDVDFFLRLRAAGHVGMVRDFVYHYRIHPSSSSSAKIHTFLIPALKMRIINLKNGLIHSHELTEKVVYQAYIRAAHFFNHPELIPEMLEFVKEQSPEFLPSLLKFEKWSATPFGKRMTWLKVHWQGVRSRIGRLFGFPV